MDALRTLFMVVGVLMAGTLLLWLNMLWQEIEEDYERDLGWHLMWTERIMDERDEHGPP